MIIREINHDKLMKHKPTLIGKAGGYDWYENPIYGDESPLLAVKDGKAYQTHLWEMEDVSLWVENNQ